MKMKNKQKGVVLLSALVFLIVLLTFLRFSLGSAKLSELKAGADYDDLLAREAAFMTLKNAEIELNKISSQSSLLGANNGYYDLSKGNVDKKNLNWRDLSCGGNTQFVCFNDQGKLSNFFSNGRMVGKYIIEYKKDAQGKIEKAKIIVAGHSIYKQAIDSTFPSSGNIADDSKDNFTTVVLQAVYKPEINGSVTSAWGPKINVFNGNQVQDNNNKKEIDAKLYTCDLNEINNIIVATTKTDGNQGITGGSGDYINPAFCNPKTSKYYNNQHLDPLTIVPALGAAVSNASTTSGSLERVSLREINGF